MKKILWLLIRLRIFYLCYVELRSPQKVIKAYRFMTQIRNHLWGGNLKKVHKVDGKYFMNIYSPAWPSPVYDQYLKREINRYFAAGRWQPDLSFVFMAITRKCPLRCEHCFEANNLYHAELFNRDELLRTVKLLQHEGALQFHFSGGEPLVRVKDLVDVLKVASQKSACWVATSGFNLTSSNALQLKQAGCSGVMVSIDHYVPELHNAFRHHPRSFAEAVDGVRAAKGVGLAVCLSVCVTKEFIEGGHLMPYLHFAKRMGVHFVQLLEPKDVGNYFGKDVRLREEHIKIVEDLFLKVNHSRAFRSFPTVLYHGYHQNRIGCFAGSRSIYIDSVGNVHACPFCHTKSYNILDLIRSNGTVLPQKENACPRYKTVV
jgi:MoaA/NifB/PqqE/SkfB family radical SAM enzyme